MTEGQIYLYDPGIRRFEVKNSVFKSVPETLDCLIGLSTIALAFGTAVIFIMKTRVVNDASRFLRLFFCFHFL